MQHSNSFFPTSFPPAEAEVTAATADITITHNYYSRLLQEGNDDNDGGLVTTENLRFLYLNTRDNPEFRDRMSSLSSSSGSEVQTDLFKIVRLRCIIETRRSYPAILTGSLQPHHSGPR